MSDSISFTVPLVPPSVNEYKVPIWRQRRFYVTPQAEAFIDAVATCARGATIAGEGLRYELEVEIFLGKKQKGDGDNFWKVIADSLVKAGVIHSDAAVDSWILRKGRDWVNPRTEITVRIYIPSESTEKHA